jgi:hypothetical protein
MEYIIYAMWRRGGGMALLSKSFGTWLILSVSDPTAEYFNIVQADNFFKTFFFILLFVYLVLKEDVWDGNYKQFPSYWCFCTELVVFFILLVLSED